MRIQVDYDDTEVTRMLQRLIDAGGNPRPALLEIGEELVDSTKARFNPGTGPDGVPWARNSEETIRSKGRDKPLVHLGTLMEQIHYQLSGDDTLEVGSSMEYAAIHQFGGQINKAAQSRLVRHRTNAKGDLLKSKKGLLIFAKDSHKRAVGRWFEQSAHTIDIPARPFIGVSAEDEEKIIDLFNDYLGKQIQP